MRLGIVTLIFVSFTCVVAGLEGNGRLFGILPKALIVLIILIVLVELIWVLVLLRKSLVDLVVSPLHTNTHTLPPDICVMGWKGKLALMMLLASRMRLT